jgi:DNA-binding MarR family transcriptional regulator
MAETGIPKQVNAIRAFNRFYTRKIGVLDGMASSPFSLAEARVLYELANRRQPTATDIRKELGLDAGYVSRMLRDFERRKFVTRERSKQDERQRFLSLTSKGRSAFAPLDARSNQHVAAMLEDLSPSERKELVDSVQKVRRLLDDRAEAKTSYLLRPHQPGDRGWILHRQALLYADEYGWMGPTRRWPPKLWRNSSRITIPGANAPGWPKKMEKGLVPFSLPRDQTKL